MHVRCTSSTHNSKIPLVWGGAEAVDSQEFLLGLCGLNPDPISDQKI